MFVNVVEKRVGFLCGWTLSIILLLLSHSMLKIRYMMNQVGVRTMKEEALDRVGSVCFHVCFSYERKIWIMKKESRRKPLGIRAKKFHPSAPSSAESETGVIWAKCG